MFVDMELKWIVDQKKKSNNKRNLWNTWKILSMRWWKWYGVTQAVEWRYLKEKKDRRIENVFHIKFEKKDTQKTHSSVHPHVTNWKFCAPFGFNLHNRYSSGNWHSHSLPAHLLTLLILASTSFHLSLMCVIFCAWFNFYWLLVDKENEIFKSSDSMTATMTRARLNFHIHLHSTSKKLPSRKSIHSFSNVAVDGWSDFECWLRSFS